MTKVATFKDILIIEMGQSPKAEFVNELGDGIPLLNGPAEFTSKYPVPKQFTTNGNRFAEPNDILFCVRGSTTGRMNVADQKYAIGRGLAAIRHRSGGELNAFVKGLIEQNLDGLLGGTMGSVFPNLTKDQLLEYKCVVPALSDQKAISKILSDLDSKISVNNRINQELEALAKLIYDYWFVQFDFPISAEQAARMGKPDLKGKPYKSSGGKMVYNEQLKREIPEGWGDGNLLDIADFANGIACQKYRPETDESSYRVIKIREMSDGFTNKSEYVSQNIPEKVVVRNGDVLFSWSATLEVQIWTGGIGGLNQHIFKVTSSKYPKSFYYFEILRYLQYFKMVAELRKTTMGHITRDHLDQSRIAIPPLELTQQLEEKINPLFQKIVLAKEENQKLSELRDWLLPMLMNGQVTIKEAEEKLSMAAEEGGEYGG